MILNEFIIIFEELILACSLVDPNSVSDQVAVVAIICRYLDSRTPVLEVAPSAVTSKSKFLKNEYSIGGKA